MTGLGKGDDYKRVCGAPKAGHAACMALERTNVNARRGVTPDQTPAGYGPADLQSAYDLPSSTAGNGETVAVVDAGDDPTAEADLGVYRAQYGLPPCTSANGCFEKVNQEGQQGNYPPSTGDWPVEESLDIDMVSAVCPNCHILLVEANTADVTDLGASVDEAIALGAQYISNSYSTSDKAAELQWDAYYNHPGVVITASAGDDGYEVGYPAASQYVTSVGGTTLTQDASTARGWDETVWGSSVFPTDATGTGSGCSAYEPKPSWQKDTGCANRTVADVSAVADPNTGVAIYDTTGEGGWLVVGGTSVSSPLVASVYALAGKPVPGTYPASYPYANTSALYDVTSGANGLCSPAYLCTAGPGYDGPTGWGTPDGVAAFSGGPHGDITGQVTNAATGQPVAGAEVSVPAGTRDGGSAVTNADGDYDLTLLAGSYNVTAADYGYKSQTTDGVTVTVGGTVTENFALIKLPATTISGTVTDGSGQGWPLYATVGVQGAPGAPVYTNPYTGAYRVSVPKNASYTLQVTSAGPGYQAVTQQVSVGTGKVTQDIRVPIDTGGTPTTGETCDTPGYGPTGSGGITETFTGWTGTTPQDGWTVTDNEGNGQTWQFGSDPSSEPPGSDGQDAFVESNNYGRGNSQNTSLMSPVINLSGVSSPAIGFDTYYISRKNSWQTADVDLSLDGGQTWVTVWSPTTTTEGLVVIPIPQAAGQSDVQIRFHFTATYGAWWSLDNVVIGGNVGCNPLPGGMVAGVVKDVNTGQPVNGVTVSSAAASSVFGVTAVSAGNPVIPGGFYEFFAPLSGEQRFSAADSRYRTQSKTMTVAAGSVAELNFTLQAGHLKVVSDLSGTVKMGDSVTKTLTISNTGKVAAQVSVGEQTGSFTSLTQPAGSRRSTPLRLIKGHYSPLGGLPGRPKGSASTARTPAAAGPAGSPWIQIPGYDSVLRYPEAAYDSSSGKVYAAGGVNESGDTEGPAEVYDPKSQTWTPIAPMPTGVAGGAAAFLDGKFYVYGGYLYCCVIVGEAVQNTQIYDPSTNSWSGGPGLPDGQWRAFAASAVLDGQMYIVGGCSYLQAAAAQCTGDIADTSYRYNPATNSWAAVAPYPLLAVDLACGGVAGEVVCTGGTNPVTGATYSATYIYSPATNTWSQGASLPIDLWGMGYGAANGQLLVSDGVTDDSTEATNQGFAYNPSTNTWAALPNSLQPRWGGGSACGFFQIGGLQTPTSSYVPAGNEELPGYDSCGTDGTQVPWLTESPAQVTVPVGGSVTVAVTLNGGSAAVTQPGAYTTDLELSTNTPYGTTPVKMTMNVTPPKTWGKVTGTVSGTSCTGATSSLAGATVQVDSAAGGSTTLSTGQDGQYSLWLDKTSNLLTLIVADDGWKTQTRKVRIKAGQTTTANFTLTPQGGCS